MAGEAALFLSESSALGSDVVRGAVAIAFPYLISGWNLKTVWFLIRKVAQHNVSILHGPIPFWVRWCIQLYMGVIYAYIKPIYIHVPLLPEIPSEDLLELYTSEFQYVRSM